MTWLTPRPGCNAVFGNNPRRRLFACHPGPGFASASSRRRVSPHDRFLLRVRRCDRLGRCRADSFRDALRADVVGRDQRDQQVDGSGLVCPVTDGCGCFCRISEAPVRPYQGPAEFGLSMPSRACPSRGRPPARVEDHQARLADHPTVSSGLENERTESSVLQPSTPSSIMARVSSRSETGSLFKPCMTMGSANSSCKTSASWRVGVRRQSLSVLGRSAPTTGCHEPRPDRSRSPQLAFLHAQLGQRGECHPTAAFTGNDGRDRSGRSCDVLPPGRSRVDRPSVSEVESSRVSVPTCRVRAAARYPKRTHDSRIATPGNRCALSPRQGHAHRDRSSGGPNDKARLAPIRPRPPRG